MTTFNASLFLSKSIEDHLLSTSQDLVARCITHCATKYGFDANEAMNELGIAKTRVERLVPRPRLRMKETSEVVERTAEVVERTSNKKAVKSKPTFPLPYDGRIRDTMCNALCWNQGLYTQCRNKQKGEGAYCATCANTMKKAGMDVPEYGTIQDRLQVGIMDYIDAKGRRPIPFAKIMQKFNLTPDMVQEEATKFDVTIDPVHFEPIPAAVSKKRVKKDVNNKEDSAKPKKVRTLEVEIKDKDVEALFSDVMKPHSESASSSSSSSSSDPVPTRPDKVTVLDKEDVKIITIDDKKYLRSRSSGVIYDYVLYKESKGKEIKPIGHWSKNMSKIVFYGEDAGTLESDKEELEEEYEK